MNKYVCLFILLFTIGKLYGQTIENNINELSLNDAIELGLKNNPQIKSSTEKINAAAGKFWNGISLPMPELSVSYEYVPTSKSLRNFSEKTFEVSQSLEFPTNYFLRGKKLDKEKEIAWNELAIARINIISRIQSAYYKVLANQEQIKIAKENTAIAEDFNKKAAIRYNVGEGNNLEQLTAKIQYTEALNNADILRNNLTATFSELYNALGFGNKDGKDYQLTDKLDFKRYNFTFDNLIELAESSNPQIKINELYIGSSAIEQTLAWTGLLPNFNLSYFRQTRDGDNGYYGASFGISIPLWFMFEQKGNIEEANANASIAGSELQLVKNNIYNKIKNAFTEFQNDEKQINLYQSEILPQTEEIFRTALNNYEAGEITYIEFLQARQTIINSRSNYINALLAYNLSVVSLEEAVGNRLK